MTLFDDNPAKPPEQSPIPPLAADEQPAPLQEPPLASSPAPAGIPPSTLPQDLQISWSWAHFIVFFVFGFASLIVVQSVLALYYAPHQHLSRKQYEQYLLSKPEFAVGSMVLWYAVIFLFLYVTLSVLPDLPFWRSLGWRKIQPRDPEQPTNPFIYFFSGCGLSLFVAIATAKLHPPENIPIQELFKYRNTALLFMAMAVLVAPLVEETVFRGYLYPLLAKSFGVVPGICITGILFGLMHGAQLGWTWSLVSLLTLVGIIFTFVRARTGSVFASYLLHLGYNSFIVATTIIGTKGFTKIPPGH